jgi:membrane fusion protein (multidrug efflux system)
MASLTRQLLALAAMTGAAAWAIVVYQPDGDVADEASRRDRGAPIVEVATIDTARIERSVSAVGTGRARRSVDLRPVGAGRVMEIAFAPGDLVAEGQVMVTLDSATEVAAVAEAEAEIQEARAAYDRAEALQKQGRVTGQSFEGARADLQRAEARIGRARAALADREIRAPFAGLVGLTDLTEGALVGRDTIITTLEDLSVLRVEFRTPERFFDDVAVDDRIRVETTIHPGETFNGRVVAVERRVDETSRAFRVRAEIPNPDLKLPSGLFLRVTLVFDARIGVVTPEEAVTIDGEGASVFVVDADGGVAKRDIVVGQRRNGMAEALSGLAVGEQVVTRGIQKVRDGGTAKIAGAPEGKGANGKPGADTPRSGKPGSGKPGAAPAGPAAAPAGTPAETSAAPSASLDPAALSPALRDRAPAPAPAAAAPIAGQGAPRS